MSVTHKEPKEKARRNELVGDALLKAAEDDAVILTGGKGTRVSNITQNVIPILMHHIKWLIQEGISEVYLFKGILPTAEVESSF